MAGDVIDLGQARSNTTIGFNQVEQNYNDLSLITGGIVGELAYTVDSQGTQWLPGTMGGNYYPSGIYVWDGALWVSDRNAIATQLQIDTDDITNLENTKLESVVEGVNSIVDSSDPLNPIITGGNSAFNIIQRWEQINGNYVFCYNDPARAGKIVSDNEIYMSFGENRISNNDWITPVTNATNDDSCHIALRDAVIVGAIFNCEEANNIEKDINLYINNNLHSSIFTTIANNNIYQQQIKLDMNIDLFSGDRIRLRGGTGGNIEDTVICLIIKWRKS